jgi:NAD+ kinase
VTERAAPKNVGVTFNPLSDDARSLALTVLDEIRASGIAAWSTDMTDPAADAARVAETDLMVCFGGDGTVLRCARLNIEAEPLILGVNMGRLGFLTELEGTEIRARLHEVISASGRVERRAMLEAVVSRTRDHYHALNEIVIGRATLSRAIQLAVDIDGTRVADYRCDGVIVATATGSTAYALSVGGPVLPPESHDLVVVPVAPHLAAQHAVVLPPTEIIHITLEPRQEAVLSIDGESDLNLHEGDSVYVRTSEHHARFLRLHARTDFYTRMAARLGWHRPAGKAMPLPAVEAERLRGSDQRTA